MASVKISVVGAGSTQFCTTVIRDMCVTEEISGSHVALIDINPERLEQTYQFALRMVSESGAKLTFSKHGDNKSAFSGSDFVINTAAWRPDPGAVDPSYAQKMRDLGYNHYSPLGPGEMEQMEMLWEIAQDILAYCPAAWLLMIANPVFEGTTLLQRHLPQLKMVGLCHGHFGYREVARIIGLDPQHITAKSCGLNHKVFMYDFRYKGKDAYPELDKWIDAHEHDDAYFENRVFTSVHDHHLTRGNIAQYRMWGILPIGDTVRDIDWWNHMDEDRERYLFGRYGSFHSNLARARWNEQLEEKRIELDGAMASSAPLTATYPLVRSEEQVMPIIDSIANDVQRVFQINWLNTRGQMAGLADNLAVETEGMVCGAGFFPIIQPKLPDIVIDCILLPYQSVCDLKVNAFIKGDPGMLLQAVLFSSCTKSLSQAEQWLELWLNRPGYEYATKRYKK
ncbi:MAG: hypothetical protein FWH01_14360 [Oscillospiraceae bacterium]|nr:hypothetical protein [Oscillospiraceae bacterium]